MVLDPVRMPLKETFPAPFFTMREIKRGEEDAFFGFLSVSNLHAILSKCGRKHVMQKVVPKTISHVKITFFLFNILPPLRS